MASTELAVRSSISSIGNSAGARLLAMDNYFDAKGNGEQAIAQLATKILAGQGDGLCPFASVQGIHVIQDKAHDVSQPHGQRSQEQRTRYDYRVRQMEEPPSASNFWRIGGKRPKPFASGTFGH